MEEEEEQEQEEKDLIHLQHSRWYFALQVEFEHDAIRSSARALRQHHVPFRTRRKTVS